MIKPSVTSTLIPKKISTCHILHCNQDKLDTWQRAQSTRPIGPTAPAHHQSLVFVIISYCKILNSLYVVTYRFLWKCEDIYLRKSIYVLSVWCWEWRGKGAKFQVWLNCKGEVNKLVRTRSIISKWVRCNFAQSAFLCFEWNTAMMVGK